MKQVPTKITSDTYSSTEFNELPSQELQNTVLGSGQALTSADLNQLGKAISIYAGAGDFYTESGSANVYVLSPIGTPARQVSPTLIDGLRVRFLAGNDNTGASTINLNGIGASEALQNGSPLTGGEILAGDIIEAIFSTVSVGFEIVNKAPSSKDSISGLKSLLKAQLKTGVIVDVTGFYTKGDGGGDPFIWDSLSTATVDDVVTFASNEGGDGRWTRLRETQLTPIMAGALDDATDQSTELNNYFSSGKSMLYPDKSYVATSVVTIPLGATVHADQGAILDFSSATVLGNFPDSNALLIGGGSFTAIPDLSVNAVRGVRELVFVSDPLTTQGDILVAWNPTQGSFNGADIAYHAGEYFQVAIDEGTTQVVNGPIYDSYLTTAVDMFKLNGGAVNITGALKVIGPDDTALKTVRTVRLSHLVDCNIDINAESKSRVALGFKNCFNVNGNWRGVQVRDNALDDYGMVISNCQHMYGVGYWYGEKHGVTSGGNSENGAVVNRDIQLKGFFAGSDSAASALLWHGNSEFCKAEGTFMGAITTAGDNMEFDGFVYAKLNGVCIQGTEMLGLNHNFDGMICISEGDPSATSRGVVDFGGNTTIFTANTKRGGKLKITNLVIDAPNANGALIKIVNSAATFTERSQIDVSGTTIKQDSGALSAGLQVSKTGGDDFDVLYLNGFDTGDNDPGYSISAVTAVRGWRDGGTVQFTGDTGASFVTTAVVLNKEAPTTNYRVVMTFEDVSSGGSRFLPEASSKGKTGFTGAAWTADAGNFGSTNQFDSDWVAVMEE